MSHDAISTKMQWSTTGSRGVHSRVKTHRPPRVLVVFIQGSNAPPTSLDFPCISSPVWSSTGAKPFCHVIVSSASGFRIRQQRRPGCPVRRKGRDHALIAQPPGVITRSQGQGEPGALSPALRSRPREKVGHAGELLEFLGTLHTTLSKSMIYLHSGAATRI